VDGQVAGRIASALDGQSQLDRGLADVVGHSEGAWLLCRQCSYGENGQAGPSRLAEAVEDCLVLGEMGLW
jgi:hypothetical protein